MVVVRESPRAKASSDSNLATWPPVSPLHTLLSSPSGRKKWRDRQTDVSRRTPSPSPSPQRYPRGHQHLSSASPTGKKHASVQEEMDGTGEEGPDEEEEILKLKLARIDAELRLKQLQKSKKQLGGDPHQQQSTVKHSHGESSHNPRQPQTANYSEMVQVPLSPRRQDSQPQGQTSPARKRLGIEYGPTASDTSLKRARSAGRRLNQLHSESSPRAYPGSDQKKSLSFNERLARSKEASDEQQTKQSRITDARSHAFGLLGRGMTNSTHFAKGTNDSGPKPSNAPHQSAIQQAVKSREPKGTGLFTPRTQVTLPPAEQKPPDKKEASSEGFDPFSQIQLAKRHVAHVDVAREMKDKEVYTIPRLFKEVVSPHYDPPDCETDYVVFAILASKSSPYDTKASHMTSDQNKPQEDANASRNKFMVLHLTDLKWELDCFLFGTGFDQFWKLTPGTLLAILNPSIMPPKTNQHNGRFSLKLGSCEDMVMEIGTARDLGFCVSKKKDGQQCAQWIDTRHTDICEFHLNLMIDKNRKHRMEVNSMWRGENEKDGDNRTKSHRIEGFGRKKQQQNMHFNREYGQLFSVSAGHSKSAASLLDAEDTDALHNMSQEEASRKRIAAAQKERELAKKLQGLGNGAGSEYLRSKPGSSINAGSPDVGSEYKALFDKPSAAEMGLLGNKAGDQHLSPAKDRKRHFGVGAVSSTGNEAIGWGGARKAGLLQPKESKLASPERGQTKLEMNKRPASSSLREGSLSPKKRARFALEKGIREPGRESLGAQLPQAKGASHDDNDDDDLVII